MCLYIFFLCDFKYYAKKYKLDFFIQNNKLYFVELFKDICVNVGDKTLLKSTDSAFSNAGITLIRFRQKMATWTLV